MALSPDEVKQIYQRQVVKFSGRVTSRVIASQSAQAWTALSPKTTIPFYKELATSNELASDYSKSIGTNGALGDAALATGLIGLWHLNEPANATGTGAILDASSKGNNGSVSGGVTLGTSGKFGTGATFDGTGSISLGAASNAINGLNYPMSMSAWIKPSSLSGETAILGKWDGGAPRVLLETYGTDILVAFYGNDYAILQSSGTNLPLGQWSHITAVRTSNTQIYLYINGKAVTSFGNATGGSGTAPDVGTSTDPLAIGSNGTGGKKFTGSIDEVGIWSRALDPAEVLNLYRRGADRLLYQVRACAQSDCSDQEALASTGRGWKGPDNSPLSYFSELYNTTGNTLGGSALSSAPSMNFNNFGSLSLASTQYFQYRAVFESDDANALCVYGGVSAACSPELQSMTAGTNGLYDSSIPFIVSKASVGEVYRTLDVNGFTPTLGSNGCSAGVRYALSSNGSNFYYWSGTAWAPSSSYSTASDGATVTANVASFPSSPAGTGTLQVKTFLKSSGTSPCEVSNLKVTGRN